jgi:NADH-quinone oxidoreductase subunit J
MDIAFWILSIITVLGALLAISLRNLVHCVLSLILFFLGIAGHYFLLRAEFVAAAQILIYIGAVAVLILFAIMLTRNVTGTEGPREVLGIKWWGGASAAAIVAALLAWGLRNEPVSSLSSGGEKAVSSVADIGRLLVTDWVAPFEAMAVLLTAALIGAVVIALEEIISRR